MNLSQITVHLTVPYPCVLDFDDDPFYRDIFFASLEEMVSCSRSIKIPFFNLGSFSPEIRWVHNEIEIKQIENDYPTDNPNPCEHLVFSIEVPYEEEENAESWIREIVKKRISDLFILANLCRSGLIELESSYLLENGIFEDSSPLPKMDGMSVQFALRYSKQMNWPHLDILKLEDAWRWHLQREPYLEMEGFENDSISRAINAFSRLFEAPTLDVTMHLVWAMVGIEALYVRGKKDVMKQVREKVPTILGENDSFKKEFNKMYEFRSRFIHGDLDFPGLYTLGDANPELEKYESAQQETVSFAIAILIASLQEIIKGNWQVSESS